MLIIVIVNVAGFFQLVSVCQYQAISTDGRIARVSPVPCFQLFETSFHFSMLRSLISRRSASTGAYQAAGQINIPKRPLKKIRLGKARPAIYHEFNVKVELSDGSVITRKSQFPKAEIRLIQDQRNNPLWNSSRDDLVVVDANAGGRLDKFKEKYGSMFSMSSENKSAEKKEQAKKQGTEDKQAASAESEFGMDDYLSLLNEDSTQIKTGQLATKKKSKK